ncbi:MAG TPA: endolytic transglycosylase MltG [Candidatus Paceibacterota bacterium]|nr:endolytic transglycosylase MltG [Candidatus Paceibacterota bacterium]
MKKMTITTDILKNKAAILFIAAVLFLTPVYLLFSQLKPVSAAGVPKIFEISQGEGFVKIAERLKSEDLIRSVKAFEIYSVATGSAGSIKPGIYEISGSSSSPQILNMLSEQGSDIEVKVPDGASVYDIDALLAKEKVLPAGYLVSFDKNNHIEGRLYPDTYKFSEHSTVKAVVDKFLENFHEKAEPILNRDVINYKKNLIIASLVQKEVSNENDSKIVAGIIKKRLASGMRLDIDATICYLKKILKGQSSCYPLSQDDFKIDSRYNTYLHSGLPPGPIGSPNISAISAVLDSVSSPYWFYLSDPKTGKTIFAKTLDEQNANRWKYLR